MSGAVLLTHSAVGSSGRPTVFLDRDGVLIENRADHVRSASDVAWLPGAISAVRDLTGHANVVIVTNQSVIGRGLVSQHAAFALHERLVEELEGAGARLLGSAICPHAPKDGCGCRKPAPGLVHSAAAAWDCALVGAWLVGDAATDVAAGRAAGVAPLLVRTGRGRQQEPQVRAADPDCPVLDSLVAAVAWLRPQLSPPSIVADRTDDGREDRNG